MKVDNIGIVFPYKAKRFAEAYRIDLKKLHQEGREEGSEPIDGNSMSVFNTAPAR